MQPVQYAHRNAYPISADLTSIPREMLEMICQFLSAEDITHLSMASSSMNGSLSQRVAAIGMAGIRKALSERRAEEAFALLGSYCKWLGSSDVRAPVHETLQLWQCVQDVTKHACFSEEEQSLALRQIFFWACPSSDTCPDEMLKLVQDIRAAWFCRCFPEGAIFEQGNPCPSFRFVGRYLDDSRHRDEPETDLVPALKPPKSVAVLGARIEAIRLHDQTEDSGKQFVRVAAALNEGHDGIQQCFRVTLVLDLIDCIKKFAPEDSLPLLSRIDPLIESAEAEEKSAYLLAVHGVRVRFHRDAVSESDNCRLM